MPLSGEDDGEDTRWKITHLGPDGKTRLHLSMKQMSPFDGKGKLTTSLDLNFLIKQKSEWDQLDKHRVYTVSGQRYQKHDYVFVQPPGLGVSSARSNNDEAEPNIQEFWVARILEIGAKDDRHVYARVYWMYWPDDLPLLKDCQVTKTGRRNYHGKYELIASNHMDILNVCSFAGLASVSGWQENDEEDVHTGLYWRQTFDYRTAQLSALEIYCICESYNNPDKVMVSCPNSDCAIWLHADCLTDSILSEKCQPLIASVEATEGIIIKRRESKKGKISQAKRPYKRFFSAEVIGGEGDDPPQVEITDLRLDSKQEMRKWKETIICPNCATKIE